MTVQQELAVLLTDYSHDLVAQGHSNFYKLSKQLLQTAGISEEYDIKVYDAQQGELPALEQLGQTIKAVWVTGSAHDAFESDEWIVKLADFLNKVITKELVPVIGICFGHQIIGRALGGQLKRNSKGWELGIESVEISSDPEIQQLFQHVSKENKYNILEVHQDIVSSIPSEYKIIGSTPKTAIQGFYKKNTVLTFQGHPEFNKEIVRDISVNIRKKDHITQEVLQSSLDKLQTKEHDGLELAKVILKFIHDEN